jgi:hypothetical protein
MLTHDEIIERLLTQYEIDDIILLLDIDAEQLLLEFSYKITDKYEEIMEALDEDE